MTQSSRKQPQRAPAIRTFLIADIRGYTRFTQQHGDEAASRLAAKFAEVAAEGVEAWGGELVELRGDEALAVFDSARSALHAAVELQEAFGYESAAEPELPLAVGIGLDAGEAVPVGAGYRGAALNLAARLCSAAAAGEIYVSQGLVHLAGRVEGVEYAPASETVIKGIDEPVSAIRVSAVGPTSDTHQPALAPEADRPPLPPALDALVPLAGREADMRWLSWHWRLAHHGHGRAVVVSGPKGIGKTRLAAELAMRAHATGASVHYALGSENGDPSHLERSLDTHVSTLVIVDEADLAAAGFVEALAGLGGTLRARPVLLVIIHGEDALPSVREMLERRVPPERRRSLAALDREGVQAVAAIYAKRSLEALPLELIAEESGGVPAEVHRVASQWARGEAARRVGQAADRAASGRRGLRTAEGELIDGITDLELVREQARLYLTHDTGLADTDALAVCPYKGLAAFEADDAEYFFGREQLIGELVARMVGTSFVGLVGVSGSGKSSAIGAGLLPALAGGVLPGSERWIQVVMRPGERPIAQLEAALVRSLSDRQLPDHDPRAALDVALAGLAPRQRLLLVVDQFEELFSSAGDEAEREAFIELLTWEREGLKIIVALRADHYAHAATFPRLAKLLAANQVLMGPLTRAELAAIIERPAQRVGLRVEPELVEALVTDAGEEPGALPLLSTALLELWQARRAGRLTLAAYQASGGLEGAVARLAEAAYAELDDAQRELTRALFLRLAGGGEGELVVRRRVPLGELDTERDQAMAGLVEALTTARLLTTGEGYIEVAHEALMREWPRLRGWLEEDATGRQVRLHLANAAREWLERGREPGDLYRGARLAAALDWSAEHSPELNATEREFLDESRTAAEREAERQRRTNRRLRALLAGAAVFLIAALGAGTYAAFEASRAEREAVAAQAAAEQARLEEQRAEQEAATARARELAASALAALDTDPALAKLLALAAAEAAEPTIDTTSILHRAFAADRVVDVYHWPMEQHAVEWLWTDLSSDGRRLVAAGDENLSTHLEVYDFDDRTVAWSWSAEASDAGLAVTQPLFTPNGAVVVAGVYRNPRDGEDPPTELLGVHVWDAVTGALNGSINVGRYGGFVVGASDTHALVQAPDEPECDDRQGDELAVILIELESGQRDLLSCRSRRWSAAMSGNGRRVALTEETPAGPVSVVIGLDTGERLLEFNPREYAGVAGDPAFTRLLNHDGSLLIAGDRPMMVLSVADGEVVSRFAGHGGTAEPWAFAPDGWSVYSNGQDGTLRHWSAESGAEIAAYPALGRGRVSIAEGGRVLVTDGRALRASLLDTTRGELWGVPTCGEFVPARSLHAAVAHAVVGAGCPNGDWVSFVVDLAMRHVAHAIPGYAGQGLALSPDGTRLVRQEAIPPDGLLEGDDAATDWQGPPGVRDVRTGELLRTFEGVCSFDSLVWPSLPETCVEFPQRPFPLFADYFAWSPDSSKVAAFNQLGDGAVVIWDAESGRLIGGSSSPCSTFTGSGSVLFSHDGAEAFGFCSGESYLVVVSAETGEEIRTVEVDPRAAGGDLGFAGYTGDLRWLIAPGWGGALHWLDAETLQIEHSLSPIHDGDLKSWAMSPDRTLVATGSSDGFVKVWDVSERRQVHEIYVGEVQVQGLAFINDLHLAVAPERGGISVYTLDVEELLQIVRQSLFRGFTPTECARFNFGDDCPTLEDLRGDR